MNNVYGTKSVKIGTQCKDWKENTVVKVFPFALYKQNSLFFMFADVFTLMKHYHIQYALWIMRYIKYALILQNRMKIGLFENKSMILKALTPVCMAYFSRILMSNVTIIYNNCSTDTAFKMHLHRNHNCKNKKWNLLSIVKLLMTLPTNKVQYRSQKDIVNLKIHLTR